jgi:hypothetical protein
MDAIFEGTVVFIPGSAIILLSQSWKVYRAACVNPDAPLDKSFSFANTCRDLPGFGVDAFAGLGGFAYMIGSSLFLPSIAITDNDVTRAASWFVIGGACFTLSGLFLIYRYYCTLNYAH